MRQLLALIVVLAIFALIVVLAIIAPLVLVWLWIGFIIAVLALVFYADYKSA